MHREKEYGKHRRSLHMKCTMTESIKKRIMRQSDADDTDNKLGEHSDLNEHAWHLE